MKKIALQLSVIALIFCALSCEDILDKFTKFTIKDSSEVVIPATTVILNGPFSVFTPDIQINSSEEFENNNSRKDLIESAKLTQMTLILKSPDNGNFDFLNKVELFIEVDGEDSILLASVIDIPEEGLKRIPMIVTDAELKEYMNKDNYTITGNMTIDKTIESDYTIEVASEFFIDAKILGI